MLASTIARWIVAVQLAAAAFLTGFLLANTLAARLHESPIVSIGCSDALGTLAAGIVGMLIVPRATRRAARWVFGGIPVAAALLSLLSALAGHLLSPPNFVGVLGTLVAGYLIIKSFRQQPVAIA